MAFSATLTFTVNAVAKVLNRINQDKYSSEYLLRTGTETWQAFIRHTKETPRGSAVTFDRHNIELIHTIAATPTTAEIRRQYYLVARVPATDDVTVQQQELKAFTTVANGDTLQNDLVNWLS